MPTLRAVADVPEPGVHRAARRHYVELPDGRSASALEWPGEGVPLVFLHGLLDSALGWQELCERVPRRCIAVDLAGFGRSDLPSRPSLRGYAEDVAAVLDAIVAEPFVLVGHSLGGGVATAVAEQRPDSVASLVLLAPAGFGRILLAEAVSLPLVRRVTQTALPGILANRVAIAAAYRAFVTGGAGASGDLLERIRADARSLAPAAREGTKAVVRAGLSVTAFHRRAVGYRGPVTLLWGDRDAVVPPGHASGVRRALPQTRRVVWTGMGHHPQRERPLHLVDLVEAVVAAVPARSPRLRRAA
jgi:pimeloyl-ACP methyl ester carboxylesterase